MDGKVHESLIDINIVLSL